MKMGDKPVERESNTVYRGAITQNSPGFILCKSIYFCKTLYWKQAKSAQGFKDNSATDAVDPFSSLSPMLINPTYGGGGG